jgi:predicted RNA polymerase sigma factor
MLHCEARRPARRALDGRFVPLSEQDPRLWIAPMIDEAERELGEVATKGRLGRFQLEAAIQSVHTERRRSGKTDWSAVAWFYERLVELSPTLGARVGHAAAVAEVSGPAAALSLLERIEEKQVKMYQPYWAVRAHLLQRLRREEEARQAFDRAVGLVEDPAVRRFLLERKGAVVSMKGKDTS